MTTRKRIVVGLDHTPNGAAALRWAVRQAVLRGWEVVVVRAFRLPGRPERRLEPDLPGERRSARDRAEGWAMDTLRRLDEETCEAARIRVRTVDGEVVPVLADAAAGASLVVVGTPCTGSGLLEELDAVTRCPVVHVEEGGAVHDMYSLAGAGLG